MKRVRVGVIGVGRMGRNHCRVYSMLRHADLIGVYDMNHNTGRAVADSFETHYFESVQELLDCVDAVSICTHTPSHFDFAMLALRSGKSILVEKPMTETLPQARLLAAIAGERSSNF